MRIPEFYKLSIEERLKAVGKRQLLGPEELNALATGAHTLDLESADKMIENVVGVFGLPLGLGMNMCVNSKHYIVPMAIEEPSVVAAMSSASKLVGEHGGFEAEASDPVLIGQVQVVEVPDLERAKQALRANAREILNLANSFHPNMVARGGGAKDLELIVHPLPSRAASMLVVHLLVDTRNAMGANLVNGMCEGVAPLIESLTGGQVFLRILSNLTDRALVRARCRIPVDALAGRGYTGEQARDGIMLAAEFAAVDPYRAATHNKGIMNAIDPIAIATGNDWRALEAGAHAYAARGGRYTSLTTWTADADGNLCGFLEMPVKVGIVGAQQASNPTVALNMKLLDVERATDLAEIMAAAGLAQNFAAIRALATEGIQKGHMTLHARSVVTAAGAPEAVFDDAVDRLIQSGEIKVWKAREIVAELTADEGSTDTAATALDTSDMSVGYGKVVLLGEHAVVYGRHAIAAPIPFAIRARIEDCDSGIHIMIPRWGVEYQLAENPADRRSFERAAGAILDELGLKGRAMRIEVFPDVPRGMGLGGSAAMAVAIVRALDAHFRLGLADEQVNRFAFESEKRAHGNPSGIDNTVACYGKPLIFRTGTPPLIELLNISRPIDIVIGMTGTEGLTASTVASVGDAWQRDPKLYERIFDQIDGLVLRSVQAIQDHDLIALGGFMNICQGMLNALGVSTPELERLISVAREAGALGAKLTGGGGGGSMIALCDGNATEVADAIRAQGYQALGVTLDGGHDGK